MFVPWATSKQNGPLPNRGARKINIIFIISVVLPKCKVSPFVAGDACNNAGKRQQRQQVGNRHQTVKEVRQRPNQIHFQGKNRSG